MSQSKRPLPWTEPHAWARRRIRSWLKRPLRRLDMRLVDRVGFGNLRRGDFAHVIDVGVAKGTFDLYERCPDAFLDLFEPHPGHHAAIERDILATRPGRLHRTALGSASGTATLYLTGVSGSSLYPIENKHETAETPVERLDEVFDAAEIRRPSLLKIDTEGHEMAVLEGANGILEVFDCVVVEVHFDKPHCYLPNAPVAFLAAHGFELVDVLDSHIRNRHFVCADMVFERKATQ
jgi:FkbM family methyltransferase